MSSTQGDWRTLPIAVIASPQLGGNYKNGPEPSSRPLIKMGNIARVNIDLSRLDYVPDSEQVSEQHRLKYGDILFNTRNTLDLVGKVSIWRNELPRAYYNSNILRLEFRPEYCGDSQYFGYALNARTAIEEIRALATGTTSVAAVYTRDLLKLEVPVPSKPEQHAIAMTLLDADNFIVALEGLIAKKQAIKQGLLQQLLTGRTRLPGFTELWREVRLGDHASMSSGGTPPSDVARYYDGGIPWVSISDMTRAGRFVRTTEKTLSSAGVNHSAAKIYPDGVVLYAMYASLGECAIAVGRVSSSQAILGIVPGREVNRDFLYYSLAAMKNKVREMGQQGTQSNLNAGMVRGFRILLPQFKEQEAIAIILSDADDELDLLGVRLDKARAMRTGMMQQLLTGRTRLPVQQATG
jgi:type I restriction enzyme S subunit